MDTIVFQSGKVLNTNFLEISNDFTNDVGNTSEVQTTSKEGMNIIDKIWSLLRGIKECHLTLICCTMNLSHTDCLFHLKNIGIFNINIILGA